MLSLLRQLLRLLANGVRADKTVLVALPRGDMAIDEDLIFAGAMKKKSNHFWTSK
jgi:hypothetical protein